MQFLCYLTTLPVAVITNKFARSIIGVILTGNAEVLGGKPSLPVYALAVERRHRVIYIFARPLVRCVPCFRSGVKAAGA